MESGDKEMEYQIKTAAHDEIYLHLVNCNHSFIPPLSGKTDLQEYAKKLFEKSVTFEAWSGSQLAGLIAAYFSDQENKAAFISNVSVMEQFTRRGIGSELMERCFDFGRKEGFKTIELMVASANNAAIHLYEKQGFVITERSENEVRMKREL